MFCSTMNAFGHNHTTSLIIFNLLEHPLPCQKCKLKEPNMGDDYEYVSYKSPKTIVAETVYHFFRGGLYGAAFGMVTPFYEAGTKGAIREAKTGIFRPAPVFGSLSSVPSNALIFGSLLAVQRFTCKTTEFLRGKQDPWNDVAGCLVAYPYYQTCLTKHAVLHNRVVGGLLLASIAFANAP